jgi:cbb3-type cytochrome oxidase maturation protein
MSVIILLIGASLAMALLFLGAFIWSVRSGQFEDTTTPSMRILAEDADRPAPGLRKGSEVSHPPPPPKPGEIEPGATPGRAASPAHVET